LRKLLFFRAKLMRKDRKILRFVPQKLRKIFANGNRTFYLAHYPIGDIGAMTVNGNIYFY